MNREGKIRRVIIFRALEDSTGNGAVAEVAWRHATGKDL
jgi:hypothetical protein